MVCPFAFLLLLPGAKPLLASLLNGVLADKIINVSHARPWALIVGCVFLFVSIAFYQRLLSSAVVEATPSFVPDTQFGVDAAKVEEWFKALGPVGREMYFKATIIDVLCIVPSYVCVLSLIIARSCQPSWHYMARNACVLPLLMALFDIVETSGFMYWVYAFERGEPLEATLNLILPYCNMAKWVLLACSLASLLACSFSSVMSSELAGVVFSDLAGSASKPKADKVKST